MKIFTTTLLASFFAISLTSKSQVSETEYKDLKIDTNITFFNEAAYVSEKLNNYSTARHHCLINFKNGMIKFVRSYHKSPGTNVVKAARQHKIVQVRLLNDGFVFVQCYDASFIYNITTNVLYNDDYKIRKFEGAGLTIKIVGTADNRLK